MVGDVRGLWDQEVKKKKCVKEVRTADRLSIWCQGGCWRLCRRVSRNKSGLGGAEEKREVRVERAPSTTLLTVHFMEEP